MCGKKGVRVVSDKVPGVRWFVSAPFKRTDKGHDLEVNNLLISIQHVLIDYLLWLMVIASLGNEHESQSFSQLGCPEGRHDDL